MSKLLAVLATVLVLIALATGAWWHLHVTRIAAIGNFAECGAAGYPILESYPAQCRTPDGRSFTQDIGNELEKMDLIRMATPRPGQVVRSPLMIDGEARGAWFFEASFPVHLEDSAGTVVATAIAQAQGEWMTTEFVPFQTTLIIPPGVYGQGTLVVAKDNPSGLPEHADELRVPIMIQN